MLDHNHSRYDSHSMNIKWKYSQAPKPLPRYPLLQVCRSIPDIISGRYGGRNVSSINTLVVAHASCTLIEY